MSRTYRKPFFLVRETDVEYCNWRNCSEDEALRERARLSRDGNCIRTTSNTGFKDEANGHIRLQNKRFCDLVFRGIDVEDTPLPIRRDGSTFWWNWD